GMRDGHVTGVQTCALPIFGPAASPFLDWWCDRQERAALEPGGARQWGEWTELVPALFAFHALRDPGCGASMWNLHTREIRATNRSEERRVGKAGEILRGRW